MANACAAGKAASFTAFLTENEQLLAQRALKDANTSQHLFFGGYNNAGRKVLCVFNSDIKAPVFDVYAAKIDIFGEGELTHRDYLGALLALNIRRDSIGDIIVDKGFATVFLTKVAAQIVEQELKSIGHFNIRALECTLCQNFEAELEVPKPEALKPSTVASLRLDAVLSSALRLNRDACKSLVERDSVSVNHKIVSKPHFSLQNGDTVTVKGHGKYKVNVGGGLSKKGRVIISIEKF